MDNLNSSTKFLVPVRFDKAKTVDFLSCPSETKRFEVCRCRCGWCSGFKYRAVMLARSDC